MLRAKMTASSVSAYSTWQARSIMSRAFGRATSELENLQGAVPGVQGVSVVFAPDMGAKTTKFVRSIAAGKAVPLCTKGKGKGGGGI